MRMQEFVEMKQMALETYNISHEDSKKDAFYMGQDRGIYYCKENINLVKELNQMYLPRKIHTQNKKLTTRCKDKIHLYELANKKIRDNKKIYD